MEGGRENNSCNKSTKIDSPSALVGRVLVSL